jgi:pimeloyl-ACP methyl ester carboxylesterase
MKRREMLASPGAVAIGALGATAAARPHDAERTGKARHKTFLFIHGAWHCSIHWSHVVERLTAKGHNAVAIDFPGSGLKATVPQAYLSNDPNALATEPSAVSEIGLNDYTDATVRAVEGLARGNDHVTLVGHSFGGQTITRVAEQVPHLIGRLVYVTAFCPALQPGGSVDAYAILPENSSSRIGPLLVADPSKIGAFRLNARSADHAYLEQCRQAFYNDLPMEAFLRFAAFLNFDTPAKASAADGRGTPERWGSVPRTYVRCTLDQALPLSLQDRMIREADQMAPTNPFNVQTLESGHSPFASMPDTLADVLADL